ncbi:MAG: excisionase family DNA-binding protein [Treponema sp.]|jgi:excisionase family DNA binding protein|nr:excisionase family DNA-binding protein [Treponema sp.]
MPQFYSVSQTAKALGVSSLTVYRRTSSGEIPSTHMGRKVLIPAAFIEKLVSQAMSGTQRVTPAEPVGV